MQVQFVNLGGGNTGGTTFSGYGNNTMPNAGFGTGFYGEQPYEQVVVGPDGLLYRDITHDPDSSYKLAEDKAVA